MSLLAQLDRRIRHYGGLIVSCQPVPGSPLDNPAIVAAMALAAEQAGAVALRIEGLANLQAVRPLVTVPVIALIKRDLHDSPVRITPWLEDVNALAQAGADIIAVDGTRRQRPASVASLLAAIHRQGKRDGRLFLSRRCPGMLAVGLRYGWHYSLRLYRRGDTGRTGPGAGEKPERRGLPSGRRGALHNTPAQAAEAMRCGAWAVTVGSAITRLEHICGWYNSALKAAVCPANEQ